MESLIHKLKESISLPIVCCLSNKYRPDLITLLMIAEKQLQNEKEVTSALCRAEIVMDAMWEQLNIGHWSNVPDLPRQMYTVAGLLKVLALVYKALQACNKDARLEILEEALRMVDLCLFMGTSLRTKSEYTITKLAEILSSATSCQIKSVTSLPLHKYNVTEIEALHVPYLQRPSLDRFFLHHFLPRVPVILQDCINHWPALKLWEDAAYLQRVAGARTVPVELGPHYADHDWSQNLMTVSQFIEKHIFGQGKHQKVGYLAQHPLFDQIPELKKNIAVPDYCCFSDESDISDQEICINAWFGPAGTVSALHYDPKHNLLAQVVGEKRVIMYSPRDSEHLYPHEDQLLFNTSRVDPENPNHAAFPDFHYAKTWECHLKKGEMLYIPPKWWHHIRSLSTSFSVSFWWS